MSTFVLVPGPWHGGWWYEPLAAELTKLGHTAECVTLAGLWPGDDLTRRPVNLTSHVEQVTELVADLTAGGGQVVLVGHSYAGQVINGVADRHPARVSALVHLDTDVTEDGESCWDVTTDDNRAYFLDAVGGDGLGLAPMPFFDERTRPHPFATLLEKSRLTGAWRQVPIKRYAAALDTPGGLQAPVTMDRLRHDPDWHYEEWPVTHNVLRDGPERVLGLLRDL
ncbi:esterase [Paractinoplanes abujensis]|uniref:Pimeloyl-ACP methyl ester carboxylesterase n=1 Tax=Paractinoplanes abujensis TaxID=882441 RepID=A0A7W7CRM7_9ACTN|nr:alpha/beta fold hydrolase [Actinoplanes abujensis]MBB4691731.1 pimeloyl-ACP methyl ester carboxylesterase [Actinoplanes abujensis]GID16847.1 esterase [Actinoplanes abujensis]